MNTIKLENTNLILEDGDRGKNYPSPTELYDQGFCLFLNNKNIVNNKLNLNNSNYISKEKHNLLNSGNLLRNDLVITTRGTLGNCLLVDSNFPLPARINSGMVIIHPCSTFLQKYLYFFFCSNLFKEQLKQLQSGAAQPQLPIKDLLKISLPLKSVESQQHIVNTIGSVDDLIENKQKQIDKICKLLEESLLVFSESTEIENYDIQIVKSGINKFESTKNYIDTSCIEGVNNIVGSEEITYESRPSRANMQPIANSVWFAKMKESYKILIITNNDDDIIDRAILSTGYQGLLATNEVPLSLLSAFVISNNFTIQRDLNSVGTTMAGINNETLLKIKVPLLPSKEIEAYDKKYKYYVNKLSLLRREKGKLLDIKQSLLNKYF